jgi:hypothetical protein
VLYRDRLAELVDLLSGHDSQALLAQLAALQAQLQAMQLQEIGLGGQLAELALESSKAKELASLKDQENARLRAAVEARDREKGSQAAGVARQAQHYLIALKELEERRFALGSEEEFRQRQERTRRLKIEEHLGLPPEVAEQQASFEKQGHSKSS